MGYELQWIEQMLDVRYTPPFTARDWDDSYREINNNPLFDSLKVVVVDLSQVPDIDYDLKDLDRHIHLNYASSLSNTEIRLIFIANAEDAAALVNYYREFSSKSTWKVDVVSSRAAAQQLLK